MNLRAVLMWPDPALSQVCAPIAAFDTGLKTLAEELLQVMYAAKGRGLAAPQIGVLSRIFVVDVTWKEAAPSPQVFVNPRIASASETMAVNTEQCLSIPDQPRLVARPDWVELEWQDVTGRPHSARFDGVAAVCIQHEFDHLEGRVILDHPEAQAA